MEFIWLKKDEEEPVVKAMAHAIPQLGKDASFGPCTVGAVMFGAKVSAGIVLHNYQPDWRSIEVSCASFGGLWAHPKVFREVSRYVFKELNVYKLHAATVLNSSALSIMLRLGFKREATLRHHYGPKLHAVVVSMTQPEYEVSKWAVRHQQHQRHQIQY